MISKRSLCTVSIISHSQCDRLIFVGSCRIIAFITECFNISKNVHDLWYPLNLVSKQFSWDNFKTIYSKFSAPIFGMDCGKKCAPHNDWGIPFCCDIDHAVPTAYTAEWEYLRSNTDLWHLLDSENSVEAASLQSELPDGLVLIACLGHQHCQREYRSITCRSFPFFPYITSDGEFIGLSYYWEYEELCWVISHLKQVTDQYRKQVITIYESIFKHMPQEIKNFRYHSQMMRKIFNKKHRAIPLLHRNGETYKISPHNERMRRFDVAAFPKFGPYAIIDLLSFPDDI